jgi:hypothetical protein
MSSLNRRFAILGMFMGMISLSFADGPFLPSPIPTTTPNTSPTPLQHPLFMKLKIKGKTSIGGGMYNEAQYYVNANGDRIASGYVNLVDDKFVDACTLELRAGDRLLVTVKRRSENYEMDEYGPYELKLNATIPAFISLNYVVEADLDQSTIVLKTLESTMPSPLPTPSPVIP